jgi:hypothetical protein
LPRRRPGPGTEDTSAVHVGSSTDHGTSRDDVAARTDDCAPDADHFGTYWPYYASANDGCAACHAQHYAVSRTVVLNDTWTGNSSAIRLGSQYDGVQI